MKTEKQEMKAFLAGLQQLQRNDEFEHDIRVNASKTTGGDIEIYVSMYSNIDNRDDGTKACYSCYLYESRSKRENDAEYEKFKYLLLSDVEKEPQQK
ncbi:MAG: hypothetical protein IJR02_14675 [Bacteroidaceae bacterium]|nr:hypothetical protein [Bacteroidaceae bacterium]MBQ6751992.1 hypothetical protein [Bacteroidaceae bacterium]